jgi:alpha-1,6-mannosyltransferase
MTSLSNSSEPGLLSMLPKWILYSFLGFLLWFILHFIPRENFTFVLIGICSAFFVFGILVLKFRNLGIREILIVSVLLRLCVLDAPVQWSDDIYRFFWDGLKVRNFESPYQLAPMHDDRKSEWEKLYNEMNSISFQSPYPPVLQYVWAMTANRTGDPTLLRIIWITADLGCIYLLYLLLTIMKRPGWLAILYAFNPLVIIEGIGQLHPEILQLFFVLWALHAMQVEKYFGMGIATGLAICTKLWPILLLPLLFTRLHRADWIRVCSVALGVCVILYTPLLRPEHFAGMFASFQLYYQSFEFNASLYYVVKCFYNWWSPESGGLVVSRLLGLVWLVYLLIVVIRKQITIQKALYLVFMTLLLTSAVVHPWYLIPVLAYGILADRYAIVFWTALIFLSYSHYQDGSYQEQSVWITIEYVLFGIVLIAEWMLRKDDNANLLTNEIVTE